MEIDKAVRECSDRRLQTKYKNAVYVIERSFILYSFEEVAFSFNGGKDSTVLLHLLRAGYFLHKKNCCDGKPADSEKRCPIRTIYFENSRAFPEIDSFTYKMAKVYELQLDIISLDFKSGLEDLARKKPIKAIFIGTRIGDPNAVGQEQFSPSSTGWPPFMRVNPILDWSYRDVWAFLITCKVPYCSLYDQGYTSIGSIHDTTPNELLRVTDSSNKAEQFKPAYQLSDGRLERAGRRKKTPLISDGADVVVNGVKSSPQPNRSLVASIIGVGDEILYGTFEHHLIISLCKKLHSIGWKVTHNAIVRNDIDSVAEEVELRKSTNDLVILIGGVGPLHSDVTVAGVAKSFDVRLAPDEEFEEHLRHLNGIQFTGDRNEMALLPEGITELLHHEMLPVPLIKCRNVIILSATNIEELNAQWGCLLELPETLLIQLSPFISKHLSTLITDMEISTSLQNLCLRFPDVCIAGHRKSREGPLIISFVGKDIARIEAASLDLSQNFKDGTFTETNCE
ncbi:FAD synthetase [Zostera marina]|uniref:FAD synthase n=1 Tax=Zostera marina TaxID=29655 RepID=A0A0K9P7I2_ZOSMR|nr:FAD synthetase [Zostera marina]